VSWEPHEVSIQALDLNKDANIVVTALASRKVEANEIVCSTLIHGGVNMGDARRLKDGAPIVVQGIGVAIKWLWYVVMAATGVLVVYAFGTSIFKDGLLAGLLALLTLVGGVVAMILVIRFLVWALDRSKWPYFMR
jgi:hypothetical protein